MQFDDLGVVHGSAQYKRSVDPTLPDVERKVNGGLLNNSFSADRIHGMHESAKRLLDVARVKSKDWHHPIGDFAALGRYLEVSSAVLTNWKRRGVSRSGALDAARRLNTSAEWILEGRGSMDVPDAKEAQPMSLADVRVPPQEITWGGLMTCKDLPTRFQVRVPDAPLAPIVPQGALVTFDTTISTPRPGDGILVRDADGLLHLRRYRPITASRWEAYSMHDAYRTLNSEDDRLQLVAVYIGSEHRLG